MAIASGQRKRAAEFHRHSIRERTAFAQPPHLGVAREALSETERRPPAAAFCRRSWTRREIGGRSGGVYLDYSKNRITDETLKLLLQLAQESRLRDHIDAMFRGDNINVSENRAVLHVVARMILARQTSFCGARHIGNILVVPANAVGHHPLDYSHPAR